MEGDRYYDLTIGELMVVRGIMRTAERQKAGAISLINGGIPISDGSHPLETDSPYFDEEPVPMLPSTGGPLTGEKQKVHGHTRKKLGRRNQG